MKFCLYLNIASQSPYYWSQHLQNWTTNLDDATKFDSEKHARYEIRYAQWAHKGKILVCACTSDRVVDTEI